MTTQKTKSAGRGADRPPDEIVDRLAGLLPAEEFERALEGLEPDQVTGPGGLVSQLAGRVIETALAELTEHLGYPAGEAPPGGAGNTRNGSTPKTLKTELGPVEIKTPRDRKSPTYLEHVSVELTADNLRAIYVPGWFAHGYQVLEDSTETSYQVGEVCTPGAGGGLMYDDPVLGLTWPASGYRNLGEGP
jgi:hypothetical protein